MVNPGGDDPAIDPRNALHRSNIAFGKVTDYMKGLFAEKNAQYGDSFRTTGVRGQYIEASAKVSRLKELVWDRDVCDSVDQNSVLDCCIDLANYAAMMYMLACEGNFNGIQNAHLALPLDLDLTVNNGYWWLVSDMEDIRVFSDTPEMALHKFRRELVARRQGR